MSKWVFRKELYEKNPRTHTNTQHWAEDIDGDVVEFENEHSDKCWHDCYIVHRDWCEEIKEGAEVSKTRMHEILGVEPGERFEIIGCTINGRSYPHFLTEKGVMMLDRDAGFGEVEATGAFVSAAINHGIIRKPRLTAEQVEILKAFATIGFKWLGQEADGRVFAYWKHPRKENGGWYGSIRSTMLLEEANAVKPLVSWADTEPLDILQTLRDNGVDA